MHVQCAVVPEQPIKHFLLFLALFLPSAMHADTIHISVGELTRAIEGSKEEPDAVKRLFLEKIERELEQILVAPGRGELIYSDSTTDLVVEDGCTNTTIQTLTTDIVLKEDTQLGLSINSLFDPLVVTLNLSARIDASGRAKQNYGVRLGNCVPLASDSFDFSAVGPLILILDIAIRLNPQWLADGTLQLMPAISLTGVLNEGRVEVNVEDSLLRNVLERFLQGRVNDLLSPGAIAEEVASLQEQMQLRLQESLDGSDGSILIELPADDDSQVAALFKLLTPEARFPLTTAFLNEYRLQLLAALATGDKGAVTELLSNAAECELGGVFQVPLPRINLYERTNSACGAAADPTVAGRYSTDPECLDEFDYAPLSLTDFCSIALDKNRLGNGFSSTPALRHWAWSPGTTFDFGVLSLADKIQPLVQRLVYKRVTTPAGECALDMRVYKTNPSADGLKPLLALHGGSWQRRGTGFLGIEHMATHFANAGFVVFAPFYRLMGDNDGTEACRNATLADLLADVNDAFNWVGDQKNQFGALGRPVLFGQSAGGHLALHLAVNRAAEVSASVLFYAPVDFADFVKEVRDGAYDNNQGRTIIEVVTGQSITDIDTTSELIMSNSFPPQLESEPSVVSPMFLVHGEADRLVPAKQSVRLCNALAGDIEAGPARPTEAGPANRFNCDSRGSELHLIKEAEHAFDLCVSESLCLAGSELSADAAGAAISRMLLWIQAPGETLHPGDNGGMGVFTCWFLLLAGIFSGFVRKLVRFDSYL